MNIKIHPDKQITVNNNETLMEALIRNHLAVENICNGRGTCGKCKVRILKNSSEPSDYDLKHLTPAEIHGGVRLACKTNPKEGMIVELNGVKNQDRKEKVLMNSEVSVLNPGVKKICIAPEKPSLEDERADLERVMEALTQMTGQRYYPPRLKVIRKVSQVLREGSAALTVSVFENELLDIEAGDTTDRLFGVAVDIGTTSVGMALYNLKNGRQLGVASAENHQIAYGADVISRISYAKTGSENARILHKAIVETLNQLFNKLESETGVSKREIIKITVAGNTTMHHLLLTLDVSSLAIAPFVSVCNRPLVVNASELGLEVCSGAKVFFMPNIGGFVGGDTVGAIVGVPQILEQGNHLLVDLGTNCELFLHTNKMMLACSTAAGPAFEGAGITCGMRAKPGAIEQVTITDNSVRCDVIGNREPMGICGSGLIEAIDEMRKAGIINKQGKISDPKNAHHLSEELKKRIRSGEKGQEFILAYGKDQRTDVIISQKDIGELQLAKGAVCAGIKTLVEMAGIEASQLDSVILSGTFASYLRQETILNIGLVPFISAKKIKIAGNAAHGGTIRALLDHSVMSIAENLYKRIKHLELGGNPVFSDYFMSSMYLEASN